MINNAEKYKEEDMARRELVDLKNEADNTIHNTEKSLNENSDKLDSTTVDEIKADIESLRTVMGDSNLGADDVPRVKEEIEKVK